MYQEVIKFWFEEIHQSKWWIKDEEFDQEIKARFLKLHEKAIRSQLAEWRDYPEGRLAEIIVLDQFSRNIYRDTPQAFASDEMALKLAQEAVILNVDEQLPLLKRTFIYMPFMHSESLVVHEEAEKLFKSLGFDASYEFELKHKAIIEKFGRYPHRNKILGRESTAEEIEFLKLPGSGF